MEKVFSGVSPTGLFVSIRTLHGIGGVKKACVTGSVGGFGVDDEMKFSSSKRRLHYTTRDIMR